MSDIETDTESGNYCTRPVPILEYIQEVDSQNDVKHKEKPEKSLHDHEDTKSHLRNENKHESHHGIMSKISVEAKKDIKKVKEKYKHYKEHHNHNQGGHSRRGYPGSEAGSDESVKLKEGHGKKSMKHGESHMDKIEEDLNSLDGDYPRINEKTTGRSVSRHNTSQQPLSRHNQPDIRHNINHRSFDGYADDRCLDYQQQQRRMCLDNRHPFDCAPNLDNPSFCADKPITILDFIDEQYDSKSCVKKHDSCEQPTMSQQDHDPPKTQCHYQYIEKKYPSIRKTNRTYVCEDVEDYPEEHCQQQPIECQEKSPLSTKYNNFPQSCPPTNYYNNCPPHRRYQPVYHIYQNYPGNYQNYPPSRRHNNYYPPQHSSDRYYQQNYREYPQQDYPEYPEYPGDNYPGEYPQEEHHITFRESAESSKIYMGNPRNAIKKYSSEDRKISEDGRSKSAKESSSMKKSKSKSSMVSKKSSKSSIVSRIGSGIKKAGRKIKKTFSRHKKSKTSISQSTSKTNIIKQPDFSYFMQPCCKPDPKNKQENEKTWNDMMKSMHKIEKLDKPAKKLFKSDLCIPTYDSVMHKIMEVNNMEKCVNIVKKLMKEKHIEKDHKIIVVKKKKKSKQTNSHKTSRDSLIKHNAHEICKSLKKISNKNHSSRSSSKNSSRNSSRQSSRNSSKLSSRKNSNKTSCISCSSSNDSVDMKVVGPQLQNISKSLMKITGDIKVIMNTMNNEVQELSLNEIESNFNIKNKVIKLKDYNDKKIIKALDWMSTNMDECVLKDLIVDTDRVRINFEEDKRGRWIPTLLEEEDCSTGGMSRKSKRMFRRGSKSRKSSRSRSRSPRGSGSRRESKSRKSSRSRSRSPRGSETRRGSKSRKSSRSRSRSPRGSGTRRGSRRVSKSTNKRSDNERSHGERSTIMEEGPIFESTNRGRSTQRRGSSSRRRSGKKSNNLRVGKSGSSGSEVESITTTTINWTTEDNN